MNAANSAVIAIRGVKSQLDERLAEADDDETLNAAAERLLEAASAVEADVYQVLNRSNRYPLDLPMKVNNRLANLLSMSDRGDGRRRSGMYAVLRGMGVGETEVGARRATIVSLHCSRWLPTGVRRRNVC